MQIDGPVEAVTIEAPAIADTDADIAAGDTDTGATTVHCPNTGPMTGLLDRPLAPVCLSTSTNAKRKYAHTLELIQPEEGGAWVGVHSANANKIILGMLQGKVSG